MKAVIENEDKNIGLYYRDRIDYEKTRDDLERAGLSDGFILDETIAQMFAEIAAQQNIDDLQIISLNDPNIKEVVGADAIAGRAYHVGNGKVVIVAENLQDFADAMGTIAEEGRHIYHRNNNGLEDSEDYASFYGKQFENYFNKRAKDTPLYMIGSDLRYTAGQLGNDWENKRYSTVIALKNDRYKNYSGTSLDKKIMSDYKITEAEYYKRKSKLKEGATVSWYDAALGGGAFIKSISPYVSVIVVVDITQKWARGVGTEDRAAYLVALSYEKSRFEKAMDISGWENRFISHIGNLGARTKEEKSIVTFSNDPTKVYDYLPNKGEFLRILERGAAKYNGDKTKQPISVSDLIKMRKRQEKFIHNQFDPDIYLKPYTLERQW